MPTYNLDSAFGSRKDQQERDAADLQLEEELKAKAAAAASKAKQQLQQRKANQQSKPKGGETTAQAAALAQRQPKDEGFMSGVGNFIQDVISGDYVDYALDAVAGAANDITPDNWITKPLTEGADEYFKTPEEKEAIYAEQAQKNQASPSGTDRAAQTTLNALTGVSKGMEAGLMMPATIAARLLNQEASWSNAPAQLKNSPVGQTIFEITQVLTPTLLTAGVGAGLGMAPAATGGTALVAESALETAPQDSAEDLVAGRFLAQKMGDLANHLGYDGAQLTRDLIEGREVNSQVFVAAAGLFQNLGFNWGANKLFNAIGQKLGTIPQASKAGKKAAQVLGKNEQAVAKALDDTNTPPYSPDYEPHEVEGIDNAVPVGKPSKGKTYISDENLVAESLRKSGIGEDGLTAADRNYFTNWSAITDSTSLQRALQESTKTLKRLKGYPDDLKGAIGRATEWWEYNKGLIDENLDVATLNFANEMVEPLKQKEGLMLMSSPPLDVILREYTNVSEEGFVAAALMGEELGVRIQKLARKAVNLENAADPIDFSQTIENLLQLQDKANLFLIPLRRGKRKWAVEGTLQQRKSIKGIKDADIQGAIKKADPVKYDAAARSFETQKLNDTDTGFTIRELWERYKGGDDGAGQTLKAYLNAIAYTDPKNAVSQVDNLSKILEEQFNKGNHDAVSQLFYGFMLSRVATQVASASSNIARLVGEPMGALLTKENAYGFGQLVGGLSHFQDGLQAALRAFKENRSIVGGVKIDGEIYNLKLRQTKLDQVWQGYQKQMAADGASNAQRFAASNWYWAQSLANNPVVSVGNRFLMAQDEMAKVIFASQVATGRAYKEAAEMGLFNPKDIQRLVNSQFRNVFKDGVASGKIIDADVLDGAKGLTFQSDIPDNGNFIDNAFTGIKEAADSSAFWRMFSPFTRVSYNILEAAGRYEPTGVFRNLVPKYKAILAGEMGDVAQLQLKSQIALGRGYSMGVAGLAMFGYATGYNSGNLPKTSFLIPAPNTETGYIAVPYNKLEPFATITAVIADAVNGLRDDVISQGQYDRFMSEMMFSLGMATFDKGFLTGMNQMTAMFDVKNFGEGSLNGLAGQAGMVSPAIVRMVADWVNPYQTITTDTGNFGASLWAKFKQRTIGGAGNPIMYDELTGNPIPKTTTIGKGDDYWAAVGASVLNEFVYAGRVKGAHKGDPVRQKLNELNFKEDNGTSFRTFEGIALSLEQQSKMSKGMSVDGFLRTRLEAYFETDVFKDKYRKYKAFRFDNSLGNQGDGTRSNAYLQDIHQDIKAIRRIAKEKAAQQILRTDPDFARKYQAAKSQMVPQQGNPPEWQGLLNWAR